MKTINDFLLGLFTSNDDLRPAMMFPNLKNGLVCASDGHVLISIQIGRASCRERV